MGRHILGVPAGPARAAGTGVGSGRRAVHCGPPRGGRVRRPAAACLPADGSTGRAM